MVNRSLGQLRFVPLQRLIVLIQHVLQLFLVFFLQSVAVHLHPLVLSIDQALLLAELQFGVLHLELAGFELLFQVEVLGLQLRVGLLGIINAGHHQLYAVFELEANGFL